MKAADWIVDYLIRQGVTDSFGIPGAVILDMLYAMERRKPEIVPHLVYHEQGGAFAASGYSQTSGKLSVAYGTRGPGFTNMITGIADAYYDSLPVLFLTSHSAPDLNPEMRILNNQEIDTVSAVEKITKYAKRVNTLEELRECLCKACDTALSGRKGPAFLDIYSGLFNQEIQNCEREVLPDKPNSISQNTLNDAVRSIAEHISQSQRPVILIGNGLRDQEIIERFRIFAEQSRIPVLSSRTSQDVFSFSSMYYGHVGSHATRYSNFIISKADLIISLGNRMAVSVSSKSFSPIFDRAHTIRVDIDKTEFQREIPNCETFNLNVYDLIPQLAGHVIKYDNCDRWLETCDKLRSVLYQYDKNIVVDSIMKVMNSTQPQDVFVCDVGNLGFWVTNAYAYAERTNRILYSGSFGTLGNALPKTIGAYYASKSPVICFVGDQGFQMNSQELETIGRDRLPITIVVLNNSSSGMIKEREDKRFNSKYVHTTANSGYSVPNIRKIADAYGLDYFQFNSEIDIHRDKPTIIEISFSEDIDLYPYLPIGAECQDLYPYIERELYNELNAL